MLVVWARTLLLIAGGGALGLLVNAVRPEGVSLASYAPPTACAAKGDATAMKTTTALPPISVLPPADVAALCGHPGTLLADVRPAATFAEGHVTGAIHLPCAASNDVATAAGALVAGKTTLIVYGNTTADAVTVADEMRRRAARPELKVVVIEGGFPAWNQAGLACSSGPCLDCGARPEHAGVR
jgi:rhodanese-related sulfurtransferase